MLRRLPVVLRAPFLIAVSSACAQDPADFWGDEPTCIGPFSEQRHEIDSTMRAEAFCRNFQGTSPNGSLTLKGNLHDSLDCVCHSGGLTINSAVGDRTMLPRLGHTDALVLTGDGDISLSRLRSAGTVFLGKSGNPRPCEEQVVAPELIAAGQVTLFSAECGLSHLPALRTVDRLTFQVVESLAPADPEGALEVGELAFENVGWTVMEAVPCMERVERLRLSSVEAPGVVSLPCISRIGTLELRHAGLRTLRADQPLVVEDALVVVGGGATWGGAITFGPSFEELTLNLSDQRLDPGIVPIRLTTLSLSHSTDVLRDLDAVEHVDALTMTGLGVDTPVLPSLVTAGDVLLTSDWARAPVMSSLLEVDALTLRGSAAENLDDDFGALRRVGTLTIEECGDLESLDGLHGLESVGVLRIIGNRRIDQQEIDALIEAIDEVGSVESLRNGR